MEGYSIDFNRISEERHNGGVGESNGNVENYFFGALCVFNSTSPFSDVASSNFDIDGKRYRSIEQFINLQMFESFGLFDLTRKLSSIVEPCEFRRAVQASVQWLAKSDAFSSKTFADWRETNMEKLLRKSVYARFQQNATLRQQLLDTGDRLLVYTSKDHKIFGIGMNETKFFDHLIAERTTLEDLLNFFCDISRPDELGKNLLGRFLIEIRAKFNNEQSVLSEWKKQTCTVSEKKDACKAYEKIVDSNKSQSSNGTSIGVNDSNESSQLDQALSKNVKADDKVGEESRTAEDVRTVVMLRDEKRILYHKANAPPRSIGGSTSQLSVKETIGLYRPPTMLDRLKTLRHEKPLINPFVGTFPTEVRQNVPQLPRPVPESSTSKSFTNVPIPPPNFEGIEWLTSAQLAAFRNSARQQVLDEEKTKFSSGGMFDLEPGEVPNPDYRPPPSKFKPFTRLTNYPQIPSLIDMDCARTSEFPQLKLEDCGKRKIGWKLPANPVRELLGTAQRALSKLKETGEINQFAKIIKLEPTGSVFPPFPAASSESSHKIGRKKAKNSTGHQYKVKFTNDTAMLRHHANRWVKAGKLSSTGKYEEVSNDAGADEEQELTFEEQTRLVKMLEETEEGVSKRHYDTEVIFEDTRQYEQYLKWYAETHNFVTTESFDYDEHAEQRNWYHYYRSAVKFIDVPDVDDDQQQISDNFSLWTTPTTKTAEENIPDEYAELSNADKYELLLQQWRWKQINQWGYSTPNEYVASDPQVVSDGVSYAGQAVVYKPTVIDAEPVQTIEQETVQL